MNIHKWKIACLVLAGLACGAVLSGRRMIPEARAQGDGTAGNVTMVVGVAISRELPIVVCDAAEQTVLVYKYDYGSDDIELVAARSFRYDRLLTEYNVTGIKVDDVIKAVRRAND